MKLLDLPKILVAMVAAISIACCSALASATPRFHLVDLGTLGGTESYAYGINNRGQVVGFSYTSGISVDTRRAFRTEPNAVINPATDNLGTLGGFASSASAINELGQVVGYSYLSNGTSHGFRTRPNLPINSATDDLGTLGGSQSQANGINDLGEVVGQSFVAGNSYERAFRTGPNAAINPATDNLGALGGLNSFAVGINNSGQVTGYAALPGSNSGHAYRTASRAPINPATDDIGLAAGAENIGFGINETGQAVGAAFFVGITNQNAFRTAPNSPINPLTDNLGRPVGSVASMMFRINAKGWSVGRSDLQLVSDSGSAILHDGTSLIDLNTALDNSAAGWLLRAAYDINDHNQIVGYGLFNGATRAFRLDQIQVPEPSTLLLNIAALATLATRRRRPIALYGLTANGASLMKSKYLAAILALNLANGSVAAPFTPGNIVVANGATVTEYTSSGTIIQSITVPPADNRTSVTLRDAVIDQFGRLHAMVAVPRTATSSQTIWLSTFNPITDTWEHHTRNGWSLAGVTYIGGIGISDKYIFAIDMRTGSGGSSEGIVRFRLDDLSNPELFDDGSQTIWNTAKVGLDGFVYALTPGGTLRRFDPDTMEFLKDFHIHRGVSVTSATIDADSNIYSIDLDGIMHRFNSQGTWVESITLAGVGTDLEVFPNGRLIVGSTGATATITDTSFSSFTTIDTTFVQRHGGFDHNFIVYSAAIPEPSTLLLTIAALAALSTRRLKPTLLFRGK